MALPEQQQLTPSEERARIYIGKGIRRARNGQLEGALEQFLVGLGIEPTLAIQDVPGFWDLPREGHNSAVQALEKLGYSREAARLQAIIDRRYRPRLVTSRQSSRRDT